jgi:hypothetical protein
VIISEDNYLAHYGILRRSGRYPWGSGGPEYASNKGFLGYTDQLKKQGLSEVEIARAVGGTVGQLRQAKSIAKNEEKAAQISQAQRLKDHGYGASEIGRKMGIPESSVRSLLAPVLLIDLRSSKQRRVRSRTRSTARAILTSVLEPSTTSASVRTR